jgi:hypothetical protein
MNNEIIALQKELIVLLTEINYAAYHLYTLYDLVENITEEIINLKIVRLCLTGK